MRIRTARPIPPTWIAVLLLIGMAQSLRNQDATQAHEQIACDPPALTAEGTARMKRLLTQAINAAQQLGDSEAKAQCLFAIASRQANLGDQHSAQESFRLGMSAAMSLDEPFSRLHLLNLCARYQWDADAHASTRTTLQLADRELAHRDLRSVPLYTILGIALTHSIAGEPRKSIETINIAKRIVSEVTNTDRKQSGLGDIAVAQAKIGDFESALNTVKSILPERVDVPIRLGAIAKELRRVSANTRAKYAQAIITLARKSSAFDTPITVKMIVEGLVAGDCVKEAEGIADDLERRAKRMGLDDEVERQSLQIMQSTVIAAIASALAEQGEAETAQRYCLRATELVQARKDDREHVDLQYIIAQTYATCGNIPMATRILETLREELGKVDGLLTIATVEIERGDVKTGKGHLNDAILMLRRVIEIEEIAEPQDMRYMRISRLYAKLGDAQEAIGMLTTKTHINVEIDKNSTLAQVAENLANRGNFDGAMLAAKKISLANPDYAENAYRAIAHAKVTRQGWEIAEEWMNNVDIPRLKIATVEGIVDGLIAQERKE